MKSPQLDCITATIANARRFGVPDNILARQIDRAMVSQVSEADLSLLVRVAGKSGTSDLVAMYAVDVRRFLKEYLKWTGLEGVVEAADVR